VGLFTCKQEQEFRCSSGKTVIPARSPAHLVAAERIKPDLVFDIHSGPIHHLKAHSPRLVTPETAFPIYAHLEDIWENAATNQEGLLVKLAISKDADRDSSSSVTEEVKVSSQGWTHAFFKDIFLKGEGDYNLALTLGSPKPTRFSASKNQSRFHTALPSQRSSSLISTSTRTIQLEQTTQRTISHTPRKLPV
jgi:hypothetical protein